tara:strand:- start:51 stop:302 length:252 start_codon:yes stop_codon:yes gene_type:complete
MANGLQRDIEKAKEPRSGKTAANMLVTGRVIKLTPRADSFMLTAMYTKANGIMTRLRAKALTSMSTGPNTLETGKRTGNMAME